MHITLFLSSRCACRDRTGTSIRSHWGQRPNPASVYFSRHRPLEKLDGNHQPAFPLYLLQNTLNAGQGPSLDQNLVAQFQEWPRHHEQSGLYHPENRFNLLIRYRGGNLSEAHQVHHAGCREYRQSVQGIQPAKHITWKEKLIHLFGSIGPAAFGFPTGRELFVTAVPQMRRRDPFVVGSNSDRKPWVGSTIWRGFSVVKHYLGCHGAFGRGPNNSFLLRN